MPNQMYDKNSKTPRWKRALILTGAIYLSLFKNIFTKEFISFILCVAIVSAMFTATAWGLLR